MLQVHPDSTCDVCLDPYTFSTTAKAPHAIGCGHIFCLECLAHLNHPTSCPLCRKAFPMDRVKKLHVDPYVPRGRDAAMPDAWSLVKRLARCARTEVGTRTTEELIGEAQRWLEADDHKELFPEVDAVFSALIKYKSLQERFHDQQATIMSLTARLDEGRKDTLVENGLNQKIRDLEARLESYRHRYPGVRELARENPPPVNGSNSEDRANGGRNVNSQGNPLPSPPRPIWHPFTSRNPNFVPPGNSQDMRTGAPSQPYAHQTGAGAVYYEGANYEDRVVPPAVRDMAPRDVPPEREPAGSRSGHRDRSAERNRRRDGESDRHRRRRDRHKRDTLEGAPEPLVLPDEPPSIGNALGIHPPSLRPNQGLYSSVAPPVTSTSDPSTSRAAGAPSSRPPTSHGHAPPVAVTASVPGPSYREASQHNSSHQRRADSISLSRPSSTPIGPVLSTWAAPDLSNPSLNSLGLSAPVQDVGGANPQMVRSASATMPLTARDSVSSWGTADSGPPQGDLFSTLRPLASAPADSGFQSNDLLPRSDGQLLGVGRSAPIATPQPQRPQVYIPQADNRSYSRSEHRPRSRSQSSFYANYDPSQPPALPPRFSPDDRGFPYASVPPPPIFPHPYGSVRSVTPASRPASQAMPMPLVPPMPYINPPPVNAASRPPNTSQQYLPSAYTSQPQHSGYRSIH